MKYLLDEQLSTAAAQSLNLLVEPAGDAVLHIVDLGHSGMSDEDIPGLCSSMSLDVLVTLNVKDFGARIHYYAALLGAGVHVVVLRPKALRMDAFGQVAMLAAALPQLTKTLATAEEPTLIIVNPSSIRVSSLEDVIETIEGRQLP